MSSRRLLLATRNPHKVREISELLRGTAVELSSLADLEIADLPGEDEVEIYDTFEQNALAKARFYRKHTGWAVLADDSGLCVDALGGGPGVRSRRFASDHGRHGPDQDEANNDCLLDLLGERSGRERAAHYRCAVACVSDDRTLIVNGRVDGEIAPERRGSGGFGYDPLFLLPDRGLTFGELPADVKASCSHRAEAIRSLRRWLNSSPIEEAP